ncbi:MAG: hypothetical protein KatS3mg051_1060 [Anaerolineae bacterium]|nr:MAG: hypothetical protein KatS3mg051_1060 [Anaerolineae bacterium]
MLDDIVGAQKEYFLDLIRPIAHKCLVMLKGNHEDVIRRHYERDIYLELVTAVREMGGFGQDYPMALGYYGWLQLVFFRSGQEERKRSTVFRIYLHHGFGGGRLKGGKALNMERVLLSRDADIVLMGHTHNRDVIMSSTERMAGRRPVVVERYGVYTGTFLRGTVDDVDTYSGVRGYLPLSIGCMEIRLRPGDENVRRRIRISTR